MIPTNITIQDQWYSIVVYSDSSQTFMIEPLPKIVKCFQPLTMFVKSSLLYVWLGAECTSSLEIKGTMPRCWDFVGCFLCLRKLRLPHVKPLMLPQDIPKKQFQQQLTVWRPHKQALFCNTQWKKIFHILFKQKRIR